MVVLTWRQTMGAAGIGVVAFVVLRAWTGWSFDGSAASVLLPWLTVGTAAAAAAAWLCRRSQAGRWAGPLVVAVVWYAHWQYLLWKSLQVHG